MARSKAATKRAKAAYSRKYRASADGAKKTLAYNRSTVDERASRNKARAEVIKKKGAAAVKGKDIHHVSGNPTNNAASNLKIVKKHHEGGVKGNNNAKGKHKKR